MVIVNFQVEDKASRPRFFQEIFLVADTKFKMILKMFFLKISNTDVSFDKKTLTWKFYITNEALLTTQQLQIIDLKEFVITVLKADSKIFVIHVSVWE